MVRKQRGGVVIGLLVGLVVIYFLGYMLSARGWGYPGYAARDRTDNRYHYSSFSRGYYWGGPSIYQERSVRDGSVGGSGYRGGGISGGK